MAAVGAETEAQQKLLARFGRKFAAGEVIFRDGEPATQAFLLQHGRVRLIKRVGASERSLRIVRVGQLFGESALLSGSRRSVTAIALEDGEALTFDRETFQQVIAASPAVGVRVVEEIVRRLRDTEDQIEILMTEDSRAKVLMALIKLGQHAIAEQGKERNEAITLDVSPMELSARVGLDVETVRRTVQQFRQSDYVQIANEKVVIPRIDALFELESLLAVRGQIAGSARDGAGTPQATKSKSSSEN
jgi:CRP-like cAMP-binding protein